MEQVLQDKEHKIKVLEEKFSSSRADCLIAEEQNKALKQTIGTLKAEKSELVANLVHNTGNTYTTEAKIERGFETLKGEL